MRTHTSLLPILLLITQTCAMNRPNSTINIKLLHTFDELAADYACFVPDGTLLIAANSHTIYSIGDKRVRDTQYVSSGGFSIVQLSPIPNNPNYLAASPHQYEIAPEKLIEFRGFPATLNDEILHISEAYLCTGHVCMGNACYTAIQWRPSRKGDTPEKAAALYRYQPQTGDYESLDTEGHRIKHLYTLSNYLAGLSDVVCIWQADSLKPIAIYESSAFNINAIAYDYSQHLAISADADGNICLYDILERRIIRQFNTQQGILRALALHPNLPIIFAGGQSGHLTAWDYEGNLLFSLNIKSTITALTFNSQGNKLAVCGTLPDKIALYTTVFTP